MQSKSEPSNRALIDLREARDHVSIQLSLLRDNRLTPPAELERLKQEIELLELRITKHKKRTV